MWHQTRARVLQTAKESQRARVSHFLERTNGGVSQGTERRRPSEGHSPAEERRWRDKSGQRKKVTEWGTLTEATLESAEGKVSQDSDLSREHEKTALMPGDG